MTDYVTRMRELEAAGTVGSEEYRLLKLIEWLIPVVKDGVELSSLDVESEVADAGWWGSGGGIELFTVTLRTGQVLEFGVDTETVFAYQDITHRDACMEGEDGCEPSYAWHF